MTRVDFLNQDKVDHIAGIMTGIKVDINGDVKEGF